MSTGERVRRWVRPCVLDMQGYRVSDASGLAKLDAMENPYRLPEALRPGLALALAGAQVNRYPDPAARALSARLRTAFGIDAAHGLLLGNGSDELLLTIALALCGPGRSLVAPEPSFAMYPIVAAMTGARHVGVPLAADDFALHRDRMLQAIRAERPALVILSCPNNPTGNQFARADLEAIARAQDGVLLIDEAYLPFAGESCADLLGAHDNIVILRTVSKLGLAGLRLGYAFGQRAWIDQFDKLRLPYNVGALTQAAATFLLEHVEVFNEQARCIVQDREKLAQQMGSIPGIRHWPSRANFLLFRCERRPAPDVHRALLERGILIKDLSRAHPLLHGSLRVTVGTPEENDRFVTALRAEAG